MATILMVTHDAFTASCCGRVVFLRDGRLFLSVVPGASHQYADIDGVDETMDWIRTLADQLTG